MPVSEPNKKENVPPLEPPPVQEDTSTVREITLTDKLNKKLLESFLARLNQEPNQQHNQNVENQSTDEDFA